MNSSRTIPVIIFSSHDSAESKKHAYELHANSYVVKPVLMDEFVKKVQSIAEYWCNTSQVAA
jgi:chemotaxis family two-component system response regulator Rcp1